MFTREEIQVANSTSRSRGAVGMKAITPRYVNDNYEYDTSILDFGAGKDAAHTAALRDRGFEDVTAYDFGGNVGPMHDPEALERRYDVVFASNVINVQISGEMLHRTIQQLSDVMSERGSVILNYPASPRKGIMANVRTVDLIRYLEEYFACVDIVRGPKSTPILECYNKTL